MNIIIVGPAYPLRGGIATFDEMLCRSFVKAGHNCSIVSYSLQYPSILFPGKTQLDEKSISPQDIKIEPLINSVNPFSWYKAARNINVKKPDVVIFRYWIPFMGPALGTIQRWLEKKSTKCIAFVDNLIPHEKRPGDRIFTKYFMKGISKYLVMSDQVKNDVLSLKSTANIKLLRHPIYDNYGLPVPVEDAKQKLSIDKDCKVILFFGLIRKYKGLDLLLQALPHIHTKQKFILLIAGECYDDKKYYTEILTRLQLQNKVVWHDGFIPNEDIKYYFSAANILALPYRTATQSGVTQVAFHFTTPVLVTDVGGLGEIIHHNRFGYVSQPDPTAIAKWLDDYFENDKESGFRDEMAKEKYLYSWENFTNAFVDFINE
jgi:glycosyltransferase involved in cell wall biosynthesis